MVRRMFARLAALSFLAAGHALVVCPSTMGAGETHYCFSSSPEASLQLVGSEVVATAIADAGNKGLYALTVPENLSPGNYSVKEAGGSASSKVRIGGPSTLLLLEADKALYKPGQTARFRALALSTGRLRPQQRNLTFEVSSPEGFKLLKASSSTDETGVAQFQFPIAQEPLLGPHVARVLVDSPVAGAGAIAEANFGIEEYVLPRFEVSVAMDQSYLTVGSSAPSSLTLSGKVSANFTFGEPVLGTCTLVLWTPLPSWEAQPSKDGGVEHKMLASLAGLTLLEGKASFQLSVPRDKLRAGYGVIAEATVVYAATGERQSGTGSVSVRYQGDDLRAAVKVTDGSQVFRPGLPSQLEVKLSKPDGQVPALEDLEEIVLVATSSTVDWSKGADPVRIPLAAASFKEGLQVVEVPMAKESLSCCDPSASRTTWDEHQKACGCCVSAVNFRVERKVASQSYFQGIYEAPEGESSSACLGRGYSPSGHFLALGEPTQVDGAWSVLLRSTQPELTDLEYLVTQAGALVASGSGAISLTPRGTFWEGSLPLALPAVSGELGVLVMAKSGTASLAASAKLSRPLQLAFNLTAGFSAQEVKPGEALTVQVQAGTTETGAVPSTARAFLASLDRSAELLGSRAAISRSAIFEALKGAAEGKEPTPVAGKPWRHCGIHGEELMVAAELPEEIQVVQIGQVGSDDAVFGQPLGDHCPRPLYDGMVCSSGGGEAVDDMMMVPMMAMAEGAAAPVMKHNEEATADAGAADTTGSAAVRTFFPETWIWTDVALEPGATAASASLPVTAPDTITSWSLEAFATSPDGISAVRAEMPLRVFKDLFVEMRLPYAAVRGEDLELIVAVFNYVEGSGSLSVQVQVTLSPEVELLEGQNDTSVSVLEGEATRVSLRVRPKAVGSWTIRADAVAGAKGDAMVKKLLVKPEGIPMSDTKSIVVDLTGTDAFSETKTLSLPEMAVPDSARLAVSVVGDLLGPTISGLERLLRIPTGCGEQNMITLAPNVFVAKYLLAVGKMTPDLRERIVNNMVVGYGRELTYRHEDGSFSAFGKSDASGSTWLTAFVLRVFAEVHQTGLVAVDTGVMTKAVEFLLAQQQSDGSFKSVGKVIHQEMMGGASGSSAVPLTAYVTAALAKAKDVASVAGGLQKAANFLEQVSATTTYTALLRAHALVLAGLWSDEQVATEVLALSSTALPRRFWSDSTGVSDPAPGAYGVKTMDVEMTGYGVLALTMANRLTEAFQGASWLLERRSASGGFSSTQDTVVALNALATYAATVGQNVDLTLEVSNGGSFQQTLQITSGNADVLQTLALPVAAGELPVVVASSGNGVALVTAELQYNLPDSAVPPCYQIEVDWFSQDQETSSAVQACSLPVSDCAPSAGAMAIISVGLFTGYGASLQSLQALKDAEVIKRFELNDQRVDLYLEELHESSKTCVQFNITREFRVWNVQPAASMVYEYYKPEARGELLSSFSTQVFTDEVSQLPGIQPSVTTTMPTAASAATAAAFLTTSLLAFAVHVFA